MCYHNKGRLFPLSAKAIPPDLTPAKIMNSPHITPREELIIFSSGFVRSFASMRTCADAAHLLAVNSGRLVLVYVNGGLFFECFGHGVRAEGGAPYVPYVSGFIA